MDELFRWPFLGGLLLALLLPWLGNLLRLRDEWLATLGIAHVAAAGGLVALALGASAFVGAGLFAGLAGLAKAALRRASNSVYGAMILGGWACGLLIGANSTVGESLAHAYLDGQLFFISAPEALAGVVLCIAGMLLVRRMQPTLIVSCLFPDGFRLMGTGARGWVRGFDLLVALAVALATSMLGLMACFALLFLPAWAAYGPARNWRHGVLMASLLGMIAHVVAFFGALQFDQPYGPLLVLVLLVQTVVMRGLGEYKGNVAS